MGRTDHRHKFPLIFFQGRQFDLRLACIGAVNGLAIVAECLLSESLRVAALFGAFRPGIAVRVK